MNAPRDAWLDDEPVEVDPLLRDPLNLHGRVRRRYQAEALLRELHFDHRLDSYEAPPMADSTVRLVFDMLPRLADVLDLRRVVINAAAARVVGGSWELGFYVATDTNTWRIAASRAVLDLGWGHLPVTQHGDVRETLDCIVRIYKSEMNQKVVRMLTRWERRGFLANAA